MEGKIMASRKRERPYQSRPSPYYSSKRRRPLPLDAAVDEDRVDEFSNSSAAKAPTTVLVIGVPMECSVLDLKARFEMYGPISRTRMEPNGVAYVKFRSNDAAQSAVGAAQDSSFPLTLHSVPVQVIWPSDPIGQWKRGNQNNGLSSKLVRAEVPLSQHGRGTKLGSARVNPRDENIEELNGAASATFVNSTLEGFKGREIVAYDDIL